MHKRDIAAVYAHTTASHVNLFVLHMEQSEDRIPADMVPVCEYIRKTLEQRQTRLNAFLHLMQADRGFIATLPDPLPGLWKIISHRRWQRAPFTLGREAPDSYHPVFWSSVGFQEKKPVPRKLLYTFGATKAVDGFQYHLNEIWTTKKRPRAVGTTSAVTVASSQSSSKKKTRPLFVLMPLSSLPSPVMPLSSLPSPVMPLSRLPSPVMPLSPLPSPEVERELVVEEEIRTIHEEAKQIDAAATDTRGEMMIAFERELDHCFAPSRPSEIWASFGDPPPPLLPELFPYSFSVPDFEVPSLDVPSLDVDPEMIAESQS